MSAYYQGQDLRWCMSTHPEAAYGTAVAAEDFDREFRLGDEEIQEPITHEPHNVCGGEFHTDGTITRKDAVATIRTPATPDFAGWFWYYAFGGGTAYAVSGASDPYLHDFRPVPAGDYQMDSASVVEYYKGGSEHWRYRGGLLVSGGVRGSFDGDRRLELYGQMEFAGERESLSEFTPPECVGAEAYRMGDVTLSMGSFGGSAESGLVLRSFDASFDNRPETLDEVTRSGLFVAARDRGDRSDSYRIRLAVLGRKGDAMDTKYHAGTEVFVTLACANPTASRVMTVKMLKGLIVGKREGYSTSVRKSTHEFEILGIRDVTSATTEAQSPLYVTLQTATATYAAS